MISTSPYGHLGIPANALLEDLVSLAGLALAETPLGMPSYVGLWHDQPVEDCCDGLFLWVREWIPINGIGEFPNQAAAADRCRHVIYSPRVVLSIRRPCAPEPGPDGGVNLAEEAATASGLVVDLQALFCGVARDWLPRLNETFPQARMFPSVAVPTGAATNCAGWDWPIMLEFDGCKVGCGG